MDLLHCISLPFAQDKARLHQLTTVGNTRHGHHHLNRSHRHGLPESHTRLGQHIPMMGRIHQSANFTMQGNSGLFPESETPDIIVICLISHAKGELGGADIGRLHQDFLNAEVAVAVVILDYFSPVGKMAVLTKDTGLFIDDSVIQRSSGHDNLESGARLVHVGDGTVAHLIRFGFVKAVGIKIRTTGHCKNLSGVGILQDGRHRCRMEFLEGGLHLPLHNGLKPHVNGQPDIGSILGKLLLAAVDHDLPSLAVMLNESKSILPTEFLVKNFLDPIDPVTRVICKTEHMAEHLAVGIASDGSLLKIKPMQPRLVHGADHILRLLFAHLPADHNIRTLRRKFLRQFRHGHLQKRCSKCGEYRRIVNARPVGGHRPHGNIHREFLSVAVENASPPGRDWDADGMFLGGLQRIIVVLGYLKINQPPGKAGKDRDKQTADKPDANSGALHLAMMRRGTTAPNRLSGSREAVRKTPSGSAGVAGVIRAMAVSRIGSRRI